MSKAPGEVRALSRERIVVAAIELADADGLDAVSMRRVAEQLGSGAMSLYRHVPGKDALLAAMVDTVTGRYAYPDAGDLGWRDRMHVFARRDWTMYLGHPWMLAAVSTLTPPFGPEAFRAMEWALTALEPLGLEPAESARAIMTINNYLQGSARVALGERVGEQATDDPGETWQARLRTVDLAGYPRLQRLIETRLSPHGRAWFESGLDVILDGIEARAARSAGS